MLRLILTLCLASVAYSCCSPEYFTADTLIRAYNNGGFIKGHGKVYYDYSGGIYAAFTNLTADAEKHIFSLSSTHVDITKGDIYFMSGGYCAKSRLNESWISEDEVPHCIPSAARKLSTYSIGGPHMDLEMSTYEQTIMHGIREVTVSKHYCYPLQEIFYTHSKNQAGHNQRTASMVQFVNLEEFIADPSVFEIPSMCFKAPYTEPAPALYENLFNLGFLSHYLK